MLHQKEIKSTPQQNFPNLIMMFIGNNSWVIFLITSSLLFVVNHASSHSSWDEWWTYDGISGVDFWGLLNPEWKLCKDGRRQSPVNINPNTLIFDPDLRPLIVDKSRVKGVLENNGHSIVFHVKERLDPLDPNLTAPHTLVSSSSNLFPGPNANSFVNISGGPLSYSYSFDSIHIHFGRSDTTGSEHLISGIAFPGELQIVGYNSDLYRNSSEASKKPNGLVSISLLIQLGDVTNDELKILTSLSHRIKHRGQKTDVEAISIRSLIPDLENFLTYEGSMTVPGCFETVNWIIINKSLIISRQDMYSLRKVMQGDADSPKAPLGNNVRPAQPLNQRFIRTNIDFRRKQGNQCPTMRTKKMYQVNSKHLVPLDQF